MADQKDIGKDLEQSLKDSKRLQGDTNIELTKTINLLSKVNDLREESIAKVKSLNKQSINLKEIEKETEKVRQKQLLSLEKFNDLDKTISGNAKQNAQAYLSQIKQRKDIETELARANLANNAGQKTFLSGQLALLDAALLNKETTLSVEERQYAALSQSNEITQENVELLEQQLVIEKEIDKNIGFSGKAMGFFAEKLGIGKEYYADMVEKARELNEQGKKLTFGDKLGGLAKAAGGGIKEALTDPLTLIPIIGGAIGGLVKGIMSVFEFAVGATSKIQEMGRNIGLSKDQSIQLNNQFSNFATNSGKAYINSENLYKTFLDISKVLGVNNKISEQNLQTQLELNKFLGVDAETSAEIEKSSLITGKSSKEIAQNIFSQTKNLERATGISFNFQKILSEASKLGGVLGLSFSKYPEKISKALLATKAMGLELKQLDGMADSFLDFESSISKEFEAQLLTGKEINLAKAREAFLNNDLVTAAEEITKQVGDSNEFLSMNRIQQEAIASSMGMSRDQMADMLKQQEYLSKFNAKDVKDLHEKVRLLRVQGKEQEAINLLGDKEAYNKMVTATASEDLAGFIDKIKQSFADLVSNTKLADFVQGIIGWLSKPENIMNLVNKIKDVFAGIVSAVGAVMGGIMKAINFFGGSIDMNLISMVEDAGGQIKSANLGSLSVGASAAKDKVGSTGGSAAVAAAPSTKMGRSSGGDSTTIIMIDGQPVATAVRKAEGKNSHIDENTKY
jgi:hypothetical protein